MLKVFLLLFCSVILGIHSFSQSAQKGETDHKDTDVIEWVTGNPDSVLLMANQALQEAKKINDLQAEGRAYSLIGKACLQKGNLDSCIHFFQKAKSLFIAENNNEETVRCNINLAEVYARQYKPDEALQQLIEADSLSSILNNASLQADVQWKLGIVYKNIENYSKASQCFKAALQTFNEQKNFSRYISVGCNLSMSYRLAAQNDSSLDILQHCITVFTREKIKDSFLYATIQENLGDAYLQMDNHKQALIHFSKALTLFSKFNSPMDVVYQQYSMGLTLFEINQLKKAKSYVLPAYKISDSLKNYKYLRWISMVLTNIFVAEKVWENAYAYQKKTADIEDTINIANQVEKTKGLNRKFETEKKEKEIALLKSKNQIILWAFMSGMLILLTGALLIWLNRSRRKIKEEKILNYFATSLYNQNTIEDVFWDIAKNCISKLNFEDCVIYEFDESRNMLVQRVAFGPKNPEGRIISNAIEIPVGKGIVGAVAKSLRPEIIKDTRTDKRYIVDDATRNAEITLPILVEEKLLGIIDSEHHRAGFFTKRHLSILQKIAGICSKKVTRYFVEEGLRKKIARDLHDDMGSTLSSINIISKVALQQHPADGHLKNQLSSIKDYSSDMMESMSDMVWAINPLNDSMESLLIKMKEWAAEICEPKQVSLHFDTDGNTGLVKLDAVKRKHVFLIFKEAVNNAVKYSECKAIFIKLVHNEVEKNLELVITDDGNGFDVAHHKTGNGLSNMQARAAILQGQMQIVSSNNKGTCIHLVCPV
jgi:signal transduction histidine kinase